MRVWAKDGRLTVSGDQFTAVFKFSTAKAWRISQGHVEDIELVSFETDKIKNTEPAPGAAPGRWWILDWLFGEK